MKRRLKQGLPWLLSLAILGYLGLTTDLPRFFATLRSIDPLRFSTVALAGVGVVYMVDCGCLKLLFGRFFGSVPYPTCSPPRGPPIS